MDYKKKSLESREKELLEKQILNIGKIPFSYKKCSKKAPESIEYKQPSVDDVVKAISTLHIISNKTLKTLPHLIETAKYINFSNERNKSHYFS